MDIDMQGFCHLCQSKLISIGSNHLPVGTLLPDVQFSGDLPSHQADPRSVIKLCGIFVHLYLSKKGLKVLEVPEFGVSSSIIPAGDGRNMIDLNWLCSSLGAGSRLFVFWNWNCFRFW
jgi:hypothetical protein